MAPILRFKVGRPERSLPPPAPRRHSALARTRPRAFLTCLSLSSLGAACGAPEDPYPVRLSDLPTCTDQAFAQWDREFRDYLQVGTGPGEPPLHFYPAKKQGLLGAAFGGNWFPIDGSYQTACGYVYKYSVYNTWTTGDEADWNIFIVPNAATRHVITDAAVCPIEGGLFGFGLNCDKWHNCGGQTCIEAETTPDQSFYRNPWLPIIRPQQCHRVGALIVCIPQRAPIEGGMFCARGPWVAEWLHGLRPEIHPAEMLWWRHGGSTYLLIVQDDSNRFDETSHFDGVPAVPAEGWRPWGQPPLTRQFRIPFAVHPSLPPAEVGVFEEASRNVILNDADVTEGAVHELEVDGSILLRVREHLNDGKVRVTFESLCDNRRGGVVGWIGLESEVGIDSNGNEGLLLLRLDTDWQRAPDDVTQVTEAQAPLASPDWHRLVLDARLDATSLRAEATTPWGLVLTGELHISLIDTQDQTSIRPRQVSVTDSIRTVPIPMAQGERDNQFLLRNLPFVDGSVMAIELESGELVGFSLPAVGLSAVIRADSAAVGGGAEAVRTELLRTLGRDTSSLTPPVRKVHTWRVDVVGRYGPVGSGYVHAEDDSPMAAAVNSVLESGGPQAQQRVLGKAPPLAVEWSFEAAELWSGRQVDVPFALGESDTAQSGPAIVMLEALAAGGSRAVVTFTHDDTTEVLQMLATATVTDAFGKTDKVTVEVASHALDVRSDQALNLFQQFLTGEAGRLQGQAFNLLQIEPGEPQDTTAVRVETLDALVRFAALDGLITPRELAALVVHARRVKARQQGGRPE